MMRIDTGFSFMWRALLRVSGFESRLMMLFVDAAIGTEQGDEW